MPRSHAWLLVVALTVPMLALGAEPSRTVDAAPATELTLGQAVGIVLARNPELMAIRQQHGIAAAAVVTANIYPFNPTYEGRFRPCDGPAIATVVNHFDHEHTILLEMELHGQGRYRRREAQAALKKTDWDIVTQELAFAVRTVRAYQTLVYRHQKLELLEEFEKLDRQAAGQAAQLVQAGRLRGPDLILARAELDDVRAQLGPARTLVAVARADLRRALGSTDDGFTVGGHLDVITPAWAPAALADIAMARRPELPSRQAAVQQAEAALKLAVANRRGNISAGPTYEYDPTEVNLIGATITMPLPLWNRHQGEIQQRQAERVRAILDLRQAEVDIRQDVQAASDRYASAKSAVATFQSTVIPNLQTALSQMQQLFIQGDPSVDVLRIIDVRRRLIHSRDVALDALFELHQSWADMLAASGDLSVLHIDGSEVVPVTGSSGHASSSGELAPAPRLYNPSR
jgi:cobalt-zinc-cadmium efflux system outer membrane protein